MQWQVAHQCSVSDFISFSLNYFQNYYITIIIIIIIIIKIMFFIPVRMLLEKLFQDAVTHSRLCSNKRINDLTKAVVDEYKS
jgi:Trk-type K+ transport system membrane component